MSEICLQDRRQAGTLLGQALGPELLTPPVLVLGLVRGGAVVAQALAAEAGVPWDILIVRKIGAPRQPEYALGAYAESGALQLNADAVRHLAPNRDWLAQAEQRAARECARLHHALRGEVPRPTLAGKRVILTDDGIATGLTMLAAIEAAHSAGACAVEVAVPVLAPDARAQLERRGVGLTYLACPREFFAVGQFYLNFRPIESEEVRDLLDARTAAQRP